MFSSTYKTKKGWPCPPAKNIWTMLHFITIGILLPLISTLVQANVEKTIFLAPPASTIPSVEPELDDLGLERLSPHSSVIRRGLNASFPTAAAPEGTDSWFFVENLKPGQRYEIRVCWLATVCPSHHSFLPLLFLRTILIYSSTATNIIQTLNPPSNRNN